MWPRPNKSLDASGGSVFLNLLGAAEGALIRAAASTQTLDFRSQTNRATFQTMEENMKRLIFLPTSILILFTVCLAQDRPTTRDALRSAKTLHYRGSRGELA